MHVSRIILSAGMVALGAGFAQAEPILFVNDYEGFVAAAGDVQTIDFETLPDGSPTMGAEEITPDFNYTAQGVTFSPHLDIGEPPLHLSGNSIMGFQLTADSYPSFERNWMIADLVAPAFSVGVYFPAEMTLSIFDVDQVLITNVSLGGGGSLSGNRFRHPDRKSGR